MDIESLHAIFLKHPLVSTDTRKIKNDSIFFCLKGANFDANVFAAEALTNGASYVVIDNADYFIDQQTILVKDVLIALQELATFHRNFLQLPIIALTGSNGKTTTKELIHVVLAQKFTTKATIGNLNNHIGVPLTLLSFDESTEIGIVEMGANHQKEIEFLCNIACPDYGYITNFGKAHLEGFGGIEGVIKGKSELFTYLKDHKKLAFINNDDAIQKEKSSGIKTFSFGIKNKKASLVFSPLKSNDYASTKFGNTTIQSNLIGDYNITNINAAVTIGNYFEIDDFKIKKAIENYIPSNNRSQFIQIKGNDIILDCYNANPSSMKVAIDNFITSPKNKWLILGDMFELGAESDKEHTALIQQLDKVSNQATSFIGDRFYANKIESDCLSFYKTYDDFKNVHQNKTIQNKTILIKGSRGMALERVLELL